jgi:outer membrane protein assembly factor BamB
MYKLIGFSVAVLVLGIGAGALFGWLNPQAPPPPPTSSQNGANADPQKLAKPTDPWPQFRGGSANLGVAAGPLPQKLTKLWVYKTDGGIRSSAVLAHGRAYVGSDDGFIHAIDLATGKKAWAFETEGKVEAPPLVHNNKILVGATDGIFYCLDRDGKLLWKAEVDDKITGSAAIVEDKKEKRTLVLVGSYAGILTAFDLEKADGKAVWTHEITDPINGGIAVSNGQAIFGGCDGQLHVVSALTGKPIRSVDVGDIVACTPALTKKYAYFGTFSGEFMQTSLADGAIGWRYKNDDFKFLASPAITKELAIFGGQDKLIHAVDLKTGERRWTFKTKGRVDSSPVVSGDRLVVGSYDGRIYLLDVKTGKKLGEYEVGGRISASPAVGKNMIVIGNDSDEVYALGDPVGGGQ